MCYACVENEINNTTSTSHCIYAIKRKRRHKRNAEPKEKIQGCVKRKEITNSDGNQAWTCYSFTNALHTAKNEEIVRPKAKRYKWIHVQRQDLCSTFKLPKCDNSSPQKVAQGIIELKCQEEQDQRLHLPSMHLLLPKEECEMSLHNLPISEYKYVPTGANFGMNIARRD